MSFGPAVTVVTSGGLPVRNTPDAAPMTVVDTGGIAVTLSDLGAPIGLKNEDGSDYGGGSPGPSLLAHNTPLVMNGNSKNAQAFANAFCDWVRLLTGGR